MYSVVMFVLAIAAFSWGLSLAAYRWVALQNAWPMGTWQAERPLLPQLIGLGAIAVALLSAFALGGATVFLLLLLGVIGAFVWMVLMKVSAQSALLLAPGAAALLIIGLIAGG
jgi:hypothetical protein